MRKLMSTWSCNIRRVMVKASFTRCQFVWSGHVGGATTWTRWQRRLAARWEFGKQAHELCGKLLIHIWIWQWRRKHENLHARSEESMDCKQMTHDETNQKWNVQFKVIHSYLEVILEVHIDLLWKNFWHAQLLYFDHNTILLRKTSMEPSERKTLCQGSVNW